MIPVVTLFVKGAGAVLGTLLIARPPMPQPTGGLANFLGWREAA